MNQKLTIVGSSARAAASSAVQAGYAVCAGDLFADADLCRIAQATRVHTYPGDLAAVVGGPQPGAWMYTGALENHPTLVDDLAGLRQLWGNQAPVLRRVRDPLLVSEVLRDHGLPCPAVRYDAANVPRDGTWLIKPRRSAGGARVAFWTGTAPTASQERGHYFQQFVEGSPCSAVYVAARRRAALLGVTHQLIGQAWTGADGFRYCGSIGPLALRPEARQCFLRIGQVLAETFDLVGLFGVDAVINSSGLWPVEVNPRYTASVEVLERALGIRAVEVHASACEQGQLPDHVWPLPARLVGKAIVFAGAPLEVSSAWSDRMLAECDEHGPAWADIPSGGSTIEAGWPIVTAFCVGDDLAAAVRQLERRAACVLAG